jgi:DNA-binding NarL/FixJ family response regulator
VQQIDKTLDEASAFLAHICSADDVTLPIRAAQPFGLTAREVDVLRCLTQGKSDREIAETLFIGTRTVETHVSNLIAKLGARNRAEAAVIATREGITAR